MISFNWPLVFFLAPLPLLIIPWARKRQRESRQKTERAIKVPPSVADALNHVEKQKQQRITTKSLTIVSLFLAWLFLLTAIAQPFKPEATNATPASGRALALLVDLSTSMERRDFKINDESVDRLTVVKQIASSFIAKRAGDRIALVLFGSEAFIASPLTYDLNSVATTLQSSGIGMAGRTTAMGDALGLAIKSLRDDSAPTKTIILLSDGTNNSGTAEPEDAAKLASSLGITIHSIGLGSDDADNTQLQFQSSSADLDEATLSAIAETSGGKFFRAHTADELEKIYTEIDAIELSATDAPPIIAKRDYRNVFILLFLLCLVPSLLQDKQARKNTKIHTKTVNEKKALGKNSPTDSATDSATDSPADSPRQAA